jgi:hypothetical protein
MRTAGYFFCCSLVVVNAWSPAIRTPLSPAFGSPYAELKRPHGYKSVATPTFRRRQFPVCMAGFVEKVDAETFEVAMQVYVNMCCCVFFFHSF